MELVEVEVAQGRARRGARNDGPRVVLQNCYDTGKEEAYFRAKAGHAPITPMEPFMPMHDFQRDFKYLELSRNLNFFDIEGSKRIAAGDTLNEAAAGMYPERPTNYVWQASKRLRRRLGMMRDLIEYFRSLYNMDRDPNTFTVEEAFRSMVADVRAAKPGKERFDLTVKMSEIFGMEKGLREYGVSRVTTGEHDSGPSLERATSSKTVGAG